MIYDHIISLGGHCQTAFQIRHYFKIKSAHIFDWWATPTHSLINVLDGRFAGLFENIELVDEPDGPMPMCMRYGIMHYHDLEGAKVDGLYQKRLIADQIPTAKSKYAYLKQKFLSLKGRVLFIRHKNGHNINYAHNSFINDDIMSRLKLSIQKLLPNVEAHFLILNNDLQITNRDNVMTDFVKDPHPVTWDGDVSEWKGLFIRNGIILTKENSEFEMFFG